ncbi:hypothetical protein FQZ97_1036200 [compost metagenome]
MDVPGDGGLAHAGLAEQEQAGAAAEGAHAHIGDAREYRRHVQGVVLRVAEQAGGLLAWPRHGGGRAHGGLARLVFALDQQAVGLLVGTGGDDLDAREEHPAVPRAGQRALVAAPQRLLEVVELQGRALEEIRVAEAEHVLADDAVDPLRRQVEETHP